MFALRTESFVLVELRAKVCFGVGFPPFGSLKKECSYARDANQNGACKNDRHTLSENGSIVAKTTFVQQTERESRYGEKG